MAEEEEEGPRLNQDRPGAGQERRQGEQNRSDGSRGERCGCQKAKNRV